MFIVNKRGPIGNALIVGAEKSVNLLFYGSFYKMDYKDFDYGIQQLMDDNDFLYGLVFCLLFLLPRSDRFIATT